MKGLILILLICSLFTRTASAAEISPHWKKANELVDINETDQAIHILNEGIVKTPESAELYSLRGTLLAGKGKFKAALKDHDKSIMLTTNKFLKAGSYMNKALVENKLKQTKNAERDFKKALEIEPKLSIGYYEYGYFLLKQKRAAEAIPVLEKAKKLLTGAAPKKRIDEVDRLLKEAKAQK